MRGGFREWEQGDRVLVEYIDRKQREDIISRANTTPSVTDTAGSFPGRDGPGLEGGAETSGTDGCARNISPDFLNKSVRDDPKRHMKDEISMRCMRSMASTVILSSITPVEHKDTFFPAVITNTKVGKGLFDIRWDDGEQEHKVRRYRIRNAECYSAPWTVVYHGKECSYAVQDVIPPSVHELEWPFPHEVAVDFSLQTKGTEIPRDKLSRHSPVVTFRTIYSWHDRQDRTSRNEQRNTEGNNRAENATVETSHASASSYEETSRSRITTSSMGNSQHGHYTGIGQGKVFL